jgi:predicted aminopeptidase
VTPRTGTLFALCVGLALLLSACSDLGFYWQGASGQWEILRKRRPIADVLADASVPEATKRKLRLVLEAQDFGMQALALPEKGEYRTYADLGRPYVSWIVIAAPALQMKEYEWCYPIAGCLGYRGFFERADADALSRRMAADGYDTTVRPVDAYSTLGWLDDPVLNTFLRKDDLDMLGTLLHEQAHRRLWVAGDTVFNESYATFVEQQGMLRFLQVRRADRPELLAQYTEQQADRDRFRDLTLGARERLVALYASPLPDADKLQRKAQVFLQLQQDYQKQRGGFKLLNYDEWFARPLNNAHLAGLAYYSARLQAFGELFRQQGGDFGRFYQAAEALGKQPPAERDARLDALQQEAVAHAVHP